MEDPNFPKKTVDENKIIIEWICPELPKLIMKIKIKENKSFSLQK